MANASAYSVGCCLVAFSNCSDASTASPVAFSRKTASTKSLTFVLDNIFLRLLSVVDIILSIVEVLLVLVTTSSQKDAEVLCTISKNPLQSENIELAPVICSVSPVCIMATVIDTALNNSTTFVDDVLSDEISPKSLAVSTISLLLSLPSLFFIY